MQASAVLGGLHRHLDFHLGFSCRRRLCQATRPRLSKCHGDSCALSPQAPRPRAKYAREAMLSHAEMIGRIAVGALLGGVIGYERDRHRRPVGLRTHLIVAMTAASFMVVSSQFVYFQHYGEHDLVTVDTSRIAASVVSAVGFLAGGAILRTGATVQGLTTAAGLWLVTAIGMCAGAGMYLESAAVTLLGIIALGALRRFEDKNLLRRQLTIVLGEDAADLSAVVDALKAIAVVSSDAKFDKRLDDSKKRVVATLDVEFADTISLPQIVTAVEAVRGVRRIIVQRAS